MGAFKKDSNGDKKIRVSPRTDKIIMVGSRSHSGQREQAVCEAYGQRLEAMVSKGSSIKGCLVAEGAAEVYYRFGLTCEWDTCAMQAVVEGAGGIMRQMDGSEMLYNRENTLNEKGFYVINTETNLIEVN